MFIGIENGKLMELYAMDQTYISEAIVVLFALAWLLCLFRIWECSTALNRVENGRGSNFPTAMDEFQAYCSQRRNPVDVVNRILVDMGILGTMYGFLIALGVDVSSLTSTETLGSEIGQVISGMRVALVTSMTGLATSIYLTLNQRLLEGGYERLYERA